MSWLLDFLFFFSGFAGSPNSSPQSSMSDPPLLESKLTRDGRSPVEAVEVGHDELEKLRVVAHPYQLLDTHGDIDQRLLVLPHVLELQRLHFLRRAVRQPS